MDTSLFTLLLITLSLCFTACARQDEDDDDLSDTSIEEIARMIQQEVGSAQASSADQCDVIPIGVKPAGGPWGFLVFSSETSDRERLQELVERYNELDAARNEESGGFSTADIATRPPLILQNGVCTGEGPYAWNPGDILDFNDLDEGG
ncbi:hypothetical protein [Rhodohalobacter mucosus]|uniref:Uncharacterized protein n=1 Tax=Rhodohalobacter mucosus TaxID=2079485 RepID=A0A316TRH1_9BACT|nr:hypothetical protein [Rhodohalobacter mucosus]PWN06428.1 hypothetical protein DDZ15_07835 [Rhodohalobacter mucosus]